MHRCITGNLRRKIRKEKRTTRRVKEKIIIWADIETHRYTSLSLPAEGGKLRATATTARLARLSTHTDRTSVSTKDHINSSLSPSSAVGFFSLSLSLSLSLLLSLYVAEGPCRRRYRPSCLLLFFLVSSLSNSERELFVNNKYIIPASKRVGTVVLSLIFTFADPFSHDWIRVFLVTMPRFVFNKSSWEKAQSDVPHRPRFLYHSE